MDEIISSKTSKFVNLEFNGKLWICELCYEIGWKFINRHNRELNCCELETLKFRMQGRNIHNSIKLEF